MLQFSIVFIAIFFVGLVMTGSTHDDTWYYVCTSIAILGHIGLLSDHYLTKSFLKKFKLLNGKYNLTKEETKLWESIENKALSGNSEYLSEYANGQTDYMGSWMSPHLTKEESELLDKVHEYFYPGDYIVDPIGASQANYLWFTEVEHKVNKFK